MKTIASKGNVIIGAGVTGISAAYHLKKNNVNAVVYESSPRAGGLLDNFSVNGFRFDNAVHLSFAVEPEVREVFDLTPYYSHSSTSWCWDRAFGLSILSIIIYFH